MSSVLLSRCPFLMPGPHLPLPELELYESRQDALRHEIESQVASVIGPPIDWSISVESGPPGHRIVKRAGGISADIIVLGLGRHRPVDRVFGTETALQVIRVSHLPVLAVPEDHETVPATAVLGVDFSLFNQPTASAAISLMQVPWRAHLVHVMSGMELLPTLSEERRKEYEEEVKTRLLDFGAGLETGVEGAVEIHVLEGEPAHKLSVAREGGLISWLREATATPSSEGCSWGVSPPG